MNGLTQKSNCWLALLLACPSHSQRPYPPRPSAEVTPDGEVLLCGGGIHSPHLLQLSGIGPAKMLADYDIPLIADAPEVGANLQDHPAVVRAVEFKPEFQHKDICSTDIYFNSKGGIRPPVVLNWLLRRRGPFCTTGCDYGAFVATDGGKEADIQLRMSSG